ncbi:MAG: binding protein excisionase family [Frankiales bacterium]|nr:binding protein excisionase family [Frankiales bacterium]
MSTINTASLSVPAVAGTPDATSTEYVGVKVAAEFLTVACGTLNNWRAARVGPSFHRVGRRCIYDMAELRRFVEAGRVDTRDAS